MAFSYFLCLILSLCFNLGFCTQRDTILTVLKFEDETQCMPKCVQCLNGSNSCTKCTPGADCCNWACSQCENQTQCKACKQGFNLDPKLNICVFQYSCQTGLCLQCDDDLNICTNCQLGYFLNSEMRTCESCPIKCLECVNNYECIQCQPRTFWQSGGCRSCPQNCESCNSTTICDTCISDYFKTESGKCEKCMNQCKRCNSRKDCLECYPTYYFEQSIGDCVPCIKPCVECKSRDVCTVCDGYSYLNKTTGKCLSCDQFFPHCKFCEIPEIEKNHSLVVELFSVLSKNTTTDVICIDCDTRYFLDGFQCKLCIQNCKECNNSQTCKQCIDTYFVNNKSQCSPCYIFHCMRCLNQFVCNICSQGTYWNPAVSINQCTKCPIGCSSCNEFECKQCDQSFYLKNGNCYRCDSSCLRCFEKPFDCSTCLTGYFKTTFSVGHCYKCPEPCIECKNSTYCTRCMPEYYLSKNTCKKCKIEGCDQCKSIEGNSTNKTSFEMVESYNDPLQNTEKCIRCSINYFLKDDLCLKCFTGCQQCINNQSCFKCSTGHYLSKQQDKCLQCPSHCLVCNPLSESVQFCLKCEEGFSNDFTSSACVRCTENCIECVSTDPTFCIKCKDGFFEDQSSVQGQGCLKCKAPCRQCEDETKCLTCLAGHFLNHRDQCIKCQEGCEECSEEGCFLCESGYRLNYENLTCSKCKVQKCSKCQSSETVCDSCEDGYQYFVPKSLQTLEISSSVCFRCDQKIDGCKKCISPFWCTECFSDLVLFTSEDGLTNTCEEEADDSLWLYVAIGGLSLLVVVLTGKNKTNQGVICVMKFKGKKEKQKDENNQKQSLIDKSDYSINSEEIISDRHLKRSLRSSFGEDSHK